MERSWARSCRFALVAALVAAFVLATGPASVVRAATTYFANNFLDGAIVTTNCTVATNTDCTLRAAIQAANANAGTDTITLKSGATYQLSINPASPDDNTTGDLNITESVSIVVASSGTATVDASTLLPTHDRILTVSLAVTTGTVNITGVTFQSGQTSASSGGGTNSNNGGGILNLGGTVTLTNCKLKSNTAGTSGGGIANVGSSSTVTVQGGSEISGNTANSPNASLGGGGGIANLSAGNLTVTNSTIQTNTTATGAGGGILNNGGSQATITGSIITGNTSHDGGGIRNVSATTQVTDSTISTNTVSGASDGFRNGGGISNGGTVTLTRTSVTGNTAGDNAGGIGVGNSGSVTATDSTISGNSAQFGGGIQNFNESSTVTLTNTTVSTNHATNGNGGGIRNFATFNATNSTISSNTATGTGGGITYQGTVTLTNVTVANNTTGINNSSGTLTLKNSLVGNNSGGDCTGSIVLAPSSDGNLSSDTTCTAFTNPHDHAHVNPMIGTLQDNGGAATPHTFTHALLLGSPAINAGISGTGIPTTDQRGKPRVGATDIGAFESQGFVLAITGGNNQSAALGTAFTAPLAVSLTANDPTVPVDGAVVTFTPPASGASATLSAPTATISGGAASVNATANGTPGSYTVAATTPGANNVSFALTNTLLTSTTTLTGSPNPATAGQSVTFTATVSGTGGAPTGSVAFKEGGTTLGSGTLFGNTATFSTNTLAVGSHAIVATYSGDGTFAGSDSAPFTETINAAGPPPPTGGLQFFPLPRPVRLLDTRPGFSAFVHPGAPLTPNQPLALPGQFTADGITLPTTARALVGNATVDNGINAPAGFATLYPTGAALPLASNLNFVPGTVRPNAFTVGLGSDGAFNLLSSTGGNFIIDVTGYYASPGTGGLFFHPLSQPIRLLDTRPAGASGFKTPGSPLKAGQTLNLPGQFTFAGVTVPASARAVAGNATVDNSIGAPAGFATLFPGGGSLPLASNLNFVPGTVAPNAFTVGLGTDGSFNLFSSTGGHFIIDVTGYYDDVGADGLNFFPLSQPVRELDTRPGATAVVHPNTPLSAKATLNLPGSFSAGSITVPVEARALVGNATVDNSIGAPEGFATLYPGSTTLPLASNLNYSPGTVAPNAFIVGIGTDGTYNLFSLSGSNFVIDISGYFAAGTGTSGTTARPATPGTH